MPQYGRWPDVTFRPMPVWPHPTTPSFQRRSRHTFKASWESTLNILRNEIASVNGRSIIIGTGHAEYDIRNDGYPRANANQPSHPGIEVSFSATIGGADKRLTYATDVCDFWQHNVRSIALGLAALRAVDRYGITRRGEQYAGFAALPSGGPDPARGKTIVDRAGGMKEALILSHPDHGGRDKDFIDVMAYKNQLEGR